MAATDARPRGRWSKTPQVRRSTRRLMGRPGAGQLVLDLPVDPSAYSLRRAGSHEAHSSMRSTPAADARQVSYDLGYTARALGVFHSVFDHTVSGFHLHKLAINLQSFESPFFKKNSTSSLKPQV